MNRTFTRIAMATAGIMLAHQVASKAFRDAAFLTAWPATALPLMTVATTAVIVAVVPLFSRLLERFSPLSVVAAGFALSAIGHAAEWVLYDEGRWITVVIYLHLAGVTAVLLSGFWSLVAERFDPAGARASYGRIAASGTVGGIVGSLAVERIATMIAPEGVLILLTSLHVLCALGVAMMGRTPILFPRGTDASADMTDIRGTLRTPYLKTIATFVVLTSAGSAILDFLLKSNATVAFGGGPGLLRFFAVFYGTVQVLSFLAQTRSGETVQRLGIGGAMTAFPGGAGVASAVALILPGWPIITAVRAVEAVLRNSLFRSGYELLFVPMDPVVRRRAKTMLDVVCDRAGEAAGAGIVQLFLLASIASLSSSLLAVIVIIAGVSFWVGQRLDQLYLNVVEQQLLKYRDGGPVSLVSEAGWTLLPVADETTSRHTAATPARSAVPAPSVDPLVQTVIDLRSNDVERVTAALERRSTFERMHVAQIIQLLAWDEVLPAARTTLEQLAPAHLGMLIDAMLDPDSDFTIRRRLPRILGTVASSRSLDGLIHGLDDRRFEVRYHCSRAISRIREKNRELSIDRGRMIAVVERELDVPPQVWRGYRLLDRPEVEESAGASEPPETSSRHLEHIYLLLSTIVARDPLDAAVHGIQSSNAGVRGLAIEYLDQVLPAAVLDRLRALIASMPSGVDARG